MTLHDDFDALADLYVAGGLSPSERAEAEAHLASCAPCSTLAKDARSFRDWIGGRLAGDGPPADLEDRIIGRLRESRAAAFRPRRAVPRWLKTGVGVAAVFALVLLGGAYTGSFDRLAPAAREATVAARPQLRGKAVENGNLGLLGETKSAYALGDTGDARTIRHLEENLKKQNQAMDAIEAEKSGEVPASDAAGEAGGWKDGKPAAPARLEVVIDDRKIIRNGDVTLEVEAYEAAAAKIAEVVAAEKGFVAGADTQKLANGKIRATITLRVPPQGFEAILARFREIGTVRNQSITTQDVTKQYVDLELRLKSKTALEERLRKILAEQKGNLKELLEVEVQLGKIVEEIESIKGEIKYYDNLVGLSTIVVRIYEKDLGQPFEYVQTLKANVGLSSADPDGVYARVQKEILDAGGQVADCRMTRNNDGSAEAFVRGRVDADKFPAVREALRKLGHVDADTVQVQQTGRGGQGDTAKAGAPVKREQAVIDVAIATPRVHVVRSGQVQVEAGSVEDAYQKARAEVEAAGGRILDGSLSGRLEGASATLRARVDAAKFAALVEKFKVLGKVKNATVTQNLQPTAEGAAPLLDEKGDVTLTLSSPEVLIGEEQGLMGTLRRTISNSFGGLMWSIEKLFVGISLAGPWILLGLVAWAIVRRYRGRKVAA